MSQKHHVRSPSHGRKVLPPHTRPSKPAPLRRGASYNHAHTHGSGSGSSSSKLSSAGSKKATTEVAVQQEGEAEEDMASFLQFCMTCERQIVTPGATLLYCSEACRKKDASRPIAVQTTHSPSVPSSPTYFDHPDIVPQRSPTVLRPVSLTFSDLNLSEPPSPNEPDPRVEFARRDSEAARYLDQFHFTTWTEPSAASRPRPNRASTATDCSALPSLVHSPSSSVGTVASVALQRPLPSRHNKSYSACSTMSADVVAPWATAIASSPTAMLRDASLKSSASTLTTFRVAEASDMVYDRSPTRRRSSQAHGSLTQLFSHEAMRGVNPRQ